MKNKKALIAMSGGVDSSTAALLMQQAGAECLGITLKLYHNEEIGVSREKTCCSLEDIEDARDVCRKLGIRFFVFNFTDCFKENVIDYFAASYLQGATPNPCIACNQYLKFGKLMQRMKELQADYIVTGHYARIEYDENRSRFLLKKGRDEAKDQSYVLYMLTQEQLAHIKFPLGDYTKAEVRKIAQEHGFVNARKRESQDICFVPEGDYTKVIELVTGQKAIPGEIVDLCGNVIGKHKGTIHYTIGQRRGLNVSAGERMYVVGVLADDNRVILGTEHDLYKKELIAEKVNMILYDKLISPIRVTAKVRYRQQGQPAIAWQTEDGRLHVCFDRPQRAITKGQAVVLYDDQTVVGGGVISESF